ncbi:hypothetical protein TevJSym_bq00110 [endosymbiont of Tevnia jerichonana (vent Tica)]|uniref:Uncharacterized protein n=1 Tax=endosymbiont of Tevnia jerichonana (vent Tica) TaxID=1049564 RepID=G2FJK3_9GAMM|nr:hypothetical protein TevJSym_bq00110 [endosymbiont of Tevnia jerichonana (vent Tica)]
MDLVLGRFQVVQVTVEFVGEQQIPAVIAHREEPTHQIPPFHRAVDEQVVRGFIGGVHIPVHRLPETGHRRLFQHRVHRVRNAVAFPQGQGAGGVAISHVHQVHAVIPQQGLVVAHEGVVVTLFPGEGVEFNGRPGAGVFMAFIPVPGIPLAVMVITMHPRVGLQPIPRLDGTLFEQVGQCRVMLAQYGAARRPSQGRRVTAGNGSVLGGQIAGQIGGLPRHGGLVVHLLGLAHAKHAAVHRILHLLEPVDLEQEFLQQIGNAVARFRYPEVVVHHPFAVHVQGGDQGPGRQGTVPGVGRIVPGIHVPAADLHMLAFLGGGVSDGVRRDAQTSQEGIQIGAVVNVGLIFHRRLVGEASIGLDQLLAAPLVVHTQRQGVQAAAVDIAVDGERLADARTVAQVVFTRGGQGGEIQLVNLVVRMVGEGFTPAFRGFQGARTLEHHLVVLGTHHFKIQVGGLVFARAAHHQSQIGLFTIRRTVAVWIHVQQVTEL